MLVTLFYAMSIPVKAQVSDWKEYTVVCVEFMNIHTDYSDAIYTSKGGLINAVNEMINNGWQPLGGLVIKERELGPTLVCQAMVKD